MIAGLIPEATRGRQADADPEQTEDEAEDEDMVRAPCKDCQRRAVGCRSSCEAWAEYQTKKAADAELRRKAEGRMKQADAYVREKRRKATPWHDGRKPGRMNGRSESNDWHRG